MPGKEDDLKNREEEELELDDQQEQEDDKPDENLDNQDEQEEKQEDDQEEDESDESDDDEEEEVQKPSRRESLRIQALLQKMKEDGPSPQKKTDKPELNIDDDLDADEETKSKIKGDRESYGESRYQQGIDEAYRFSKFETRLEVDAPLVESKYPQLDKESDDFNPVLADTINRMYLSFVGFDGEGRSVRTADVRYRDFVESFYELADEIAGDKVDRTTTNIKKQASKTGIRPGGGSAKRLNLNKAPSEMTDDELEAVIKANLKTR